jgi:hypothetical protein
MQLTPEQFEQEKQRLLDLVEMLQNAGLHHDVDFETKRRVTRQVLGEIRLDTANKRFEITGSVGEVIFAGLVLDAIDSDFAH